MKPVLIGQAPSRITGNRERVHHPITGGHSPPAFSGLSGAFLAGLLDLTKDDFLTRVEAVNLLDDFPGRSGDKGDDWDAAAARARAEIARPRLHGRTVIMVGRRVAEAFDFEWLNWLQCADDGGTEWWLIPHPSGVNTWWLRPGRRRDAAELLRMLVMGDQR